jgi:hypothetical protein
MNENLSQQINSLNPWFYDIKIGDEKVIPGIGSPHTPEQLVADTQYKLDILVEQVIQKYDFTGKRILDIASNCGYFSSHYIRHGAKSVLAVEGREQFIKQGELYWGHDEVLRGCDYKFLLGDINSAELWGKIEPLGPFDFCLCCGILYHITDHHKLLSRINGVVADALLIDTRISPSGDAKTHPFVEQGNWNFDGIHVDGKPATAAHPTFDSICEFLDDRSYAIERIRAKNPVSPLMSINDNYDLDRRITLLCRKVYDQDDIY